MKCEDCKKCETCSELCIIRVEELEKENARLREALEFINEYYFNDLDIETRRKIEKALRGEK